MNFPVTVRTVIFFPMQLLAAVLVFSLPLEKRPHFPQRLLGSAAALLIPIAVAQYMMCLLVSTEVLGTLDDMARYSALSSLIWCGTLFILMVLVLRFTHALSVREAVYCASCAYLMEHMAYCVRAILTAAFPKLPLDTGTPLYLLSPTGQDFSPQSPRQLPNQETLL